MGKIKLTAWDSSEYLKTNEDIVEYLVASLEDNDFEHFKYALSQVAKAKGMTEISRMTGIPRVSLYKMFEKGRSPEFKSIQSVLGSLGVGISFVPKNKQNTKSL